MKALRSIGSFATLLLAVAACGSASGLAGTSPSASPSASASPEQAMHHAAIDIASSKYGQVLVDGQGRVLYLFAADKSTTSTCYGGCAKAWPPFLGAKGAAVDAMHGATAALTGTTTRTDGTVQVTYNGHPLYYYEGDTTAGQIGCQGVDNFGGKWWVVDPQGNAITKT